MLVRVTDALVKRIHVFGQQLRNNRKTGDNLPSIILKHAHAEGHYHRITLHDRTGTPVARVVQDRTGMPGCRHAQVWIECCEGVSLTAERWNEED